MPVQDNEVAAQNSNAVNATASKSNDTLDSQDQALVAQISELNLPAVEAALRIFGGKIVWSAADLKEEESAGDDDE
jgi:polyisoprenoid-binding protein YceI